MGELSEKIRLRILKSQQKFKKYKKGNYSLLIINMFKVITNYNFYTVSSPLYRYDTTCRVGLIPPLREFYSMGPASLSFTPRLPKTLYLKFSLPFNTYGH